MPNALRGCAAALALALTAGVANAQDAPEEAPAAVAVPAPEPPPEPAKSAPLEISEKDIVRAKVLSQPSAEEISGLYPEAARAKALGGRAAVVCEIALSTRLENCEITEEDPTGYGFGAATVKVAQMYRVAPPTYRGEPVPHAKFRMPMRFELDLETAAREADAAKTQPKGMSAQRVVPLGPLRRADEVLWAPVGFGLIVLVGIAWAVLWPPPQRRPRRKAGQLG